MDHWVAGLGNLTIREVGVNDEKGGGWPTVGPTPWNLGVTVFKLHFFCIAKNRFLGLAFHGSRDII